MAALKPVPLVAGDTWVHAWRLEQPIGVPVDLSGCSARLHLRAADGTLAASASTTDGRLTIDAITGLIAMEIPAATMLLPAGTYRYALEITDPAGAVHTYGTNTLVLLPDITHD